MRAAYGFAGGFRTHNKQILDCDSAKMEEILSCVITLVYSHDITPSEISQAREVLHDLICALLKKSHPEKQYQGWLSGAGRVQVVELVRDTASSCI